MIKEKNIAVNVIWSIVTCGIYGIIWFINLTDDAAYLNDDRDFSGGKAFLFGIITCGIYTIYWNYKMGKELYDGKTKQGLRATDNSVLYLILSLLGLSIVNWCLMQNELNEVARQKAEM